MGYFSRGTGHFPGLSRYSLRKSHHYLWGMHREKLLIRHFKLLTRH